MAAYDALVSLAQTTDLKRYPYPFPVKAAEEIRSIHVYAVCLKSFFEEFPDQVNRWEGRIRDLAHEAENFIEYFILLRNETLNERVGIALPDLEDQLENATGRLGLIAGEVMEERPAYLLPSSSSSRLETAANDTVVGSEDDVTTIRDRLCGQPSSNLQVIPIVGMGGIGKTTLARTVYDHASILQHFDFRAWITVSQNYNSTYSLRKILLGILVSMNKLEELVSEQKIDGSNVGLEERDDLYKQLEKVDVSKMAIKVFQSLKYRRYLIVMDDVWSTKVLDDVRNIFPDDGHGSRIIITTRLSNLTAYPNSNSLLHEMRVMNDAQSWNLLKQKVFPNSDCPPHLKGIGVQIAKTCAGLPLTVVLVAGLLSAVNDTLASWMKIAKSVNSTVGEELEGILSLSYTHLPYYLRPCFLYFGGFPEDEKIRAATLIKLWVAEGFVKHEDGCSKSMEEKAEDYLEDLVKRNLVIVNSRKINGKIRSCNLHDMVRDVCIRKAQEEKFLHVMDGRVDSHETIDEQRISLMLSNMDSLWAPTTRTIMMFNPNNVSKLQEVLGCFELLRVFHDASVSRVMPSPQVFKLLYLRYLALKGSLDITSAISNLVNLQTLIILPFYQKKRTWKYAYSYGPVLSVPVEIWGLPRLRHLVRYDVYILPHPPEGSNLPLLNLQTILLIKNLVWSEKMVEMIPNVKRLGLVYTVHQEYPLINQEYHLNYLKYLFQLEKLQISGSGDLTWLWQYPNFPTSLKKLSLISGGYPWTKMYIIGSLPNLQVLKLQDKACYGETWVTGGGEFPQLKYLLIEESWLRQWTTESTSFRILERLVLRSCWDLEKIPEDIGEISTLELIEVISCKKSVVESANHIKQVKQAEGDDDDTFQLRFVKLQEIVPSRSSFPPQQLHEEQGEQPSMEEVGIYIDELESNENLEMATGVGYSVEAQDEFETNENLEMGTGIGYSADAWENLDVVDVQIFPRILGKMKDWVVKFFLNR